ncbi:hypothetical protein V501_01001 [Pseudogymnoascus sp. VKM F-4519 (FW-2642)]|nr:hypothetical protein V501_01001 [Pseudogymnoascus sp. VKM F-4519 (FW-2642)]
MSKNILSPKGSVIGRAETPTPTSSQNIPPENEDMPDAPPMVSKLRETLQVKLPDTYSGNRKDLEVFLLQVELYSHFNDDKSWKGFKKEIRRMFGDIDEVKTAEDRLYSLKQTGSALTYSTEFQSTEGTRAEEGNTTLETTQGRGGYNSSGMQLNATFVNKQDWGINGESTLEGESSDEESEAESLTVSEQGTFDELAPTELMSPRCKSVVRRMAKHAHAKIRAERDKPSAPRRIPTLKGIYRNLLQGLLRLGTTSEIEDFLVQEAGELGKDVAHMATLKNMKSVELYYQDRRRALKKYDEKARNMIQRENTRPATRLERRAIEQLETFTTPPREDSEWVKGQRELARADATETDHPWHAYVY